jgi:sortase A
MAPGAPISPLTGGRIRRSRGRRLIRDISWVLIITGLLLLADAAVTLLWQEPVTAVVALIKRSQIDQRYISAPLSSPERRTLAALKDERARIAFLAAREGRQVATGDALGRIEIPRIGLNLLVVQGTEAASLEKGPGHYPSTVLPGLGRTVAIAGHRTTYLAPFRHIDAIRPGDRISLQMPYGRFVYTVQYHRIVSPSAWWITRNVGYDRLVLSACNPLYSAAQRIVVFARLSSPRSSLFTPAGPRSSIAGVLPMMG